MVKMLIEEFQVSYSCADSSGKTPLHYACEGGQKQLVKILISEFQC